MEYDFPEPLIYLINSILPDRTNVENEFIRLELEFQYTTRSRLTKLLRFLAEFKKIGGFHRKPRLLFIRKESEDPYSIYENSRTLVKKGFTEISDDGDYWFRHDSYTGI